MTAATARDVLLHSVDDRERALLAPYAVFSRESAGRRHPEAPHPYRGPYQRDRDRVLHSSAYRRLSGKTQVFTGMGDYHRTRLTHTQEVASIARTMGRALRLNEDLIEALALFHDIGHPPFGHAGEDALSECLRDDGGFSHNRFALTIAEELEKRYQAFPGLNLTKEVLAGQSTRIDKAAGNATLEAQVVDAADSITYDAHDIDDAVKLGLVSINEFEEIPLIRRTMDLVGSEYSSLTPDEQRMAMVHALIDCQVSSTLTFAAQRLRELQPQTSAEASRLPFRIGPAPEIEGQKAELESFLYRRVYRHPKLVEGRQSAQSRLSACFKLLMERPDLLSPRFQERARQHGIRPAVADYLAGMTDHFFDDLFDRLIGG